MIEALWLYASRSARNKIVSHGKDFRYVLGILLVGIYFYFVMGSARITRSSPSHGRPGALAVIMFLLVLGSALAWWLATKDHPLALTKGQAKLLLPSPLSSRQLMLLKVITTQPVLIWNALLFGFLIRSGISTNVAVRIGVFYLVMLALYGQRLAVALTRTPGPDVSSAGRRFTIIAVRAWLAAALVVSASQLAAVAAGYGILDLDKVGIPFAVAGGQPWSMVLWPFNALMAPAIAQTGAQSLSSFPAAILVVALELLLIFRATPDWERVGIVRTREERSAARRAKPATRTLLSGSVWQRLLAKRLSTPQASIAWKNLSTAGRTQNITPQVVIVIGIPLLLAATLIPAFHRLTAFATGMAAAWAVLLLLAGPNFIRNDLRLDLPRLRLLRTFPVSSRDICLAEVGSSILLLTLLQLVLLTLSTLVLLVDPIVPGRPAQKILVAVAFAVLLPGMNAINISAQNIFALMFPKWVSLGVIRTSRTANPGQYYISLIISLGLFAAAMILPAVGAVGAAYEVWPLGNTVAILVGAVTAGAVAIGEAVLALKWMGKLLDTVDLASVVPR